MPYLLLISATSTDDKVMSFRHDLRADSLEEAEKEVLALLKKDYNPYNIGQHGYYNDADTPFAAKIMELKEVQTVNLPPILKQWEEEYWEHDKKIRQTMDEEQQKREYNEYIRLKAKFEKD